MPLDTPLPLAWLLAPLRLFAALLTEELAVMMLEARGQNRLQFSRTISDSQIGILVPLHLLCGPLLRETITIDTRTRRRRAGCRQSDVANERIQR